MHQDMRGECEESEYIWIEVCKSEPVTKIYLNL